MKRLKLHALRMHSLGILAAKPKTSLNCLRQLFDFVNGLSYPKMFKMTPFMCMKTTLLEVWVYLSIPYYIFVLQHWLSHCRGKKQFILVNIIINKIIVNGPVKMTWYFGYSTLTPITVTKHTKKKKIKNKLTTAKKVILIT